MTRPVDARTDQYVEEVVALDPLTATSAGIAGHDDRLPDLSPSGYDAREELNRRALAEVAAIEPTDERERIAQEAFVERIGLERREGRVRLRALRVLGDQQCPACGARSVRPDADGDRGRLADDRRPAGCGAGGADGLPLDARGRGGGRSGLGASAVRRGRRPGARLDRPGGRCGRLLRQPRRGGRPTGCGTRWPRSRPGLRVVRRLRTFRRDRPGPSGPRDRRGRPRPLRPRVALLPRCRDRPRGDVPVGLGGAQADRGRHGADGAAHRRRRLDRRRGASTRPRPCARLRQPGGLRGLDAGEGGLHPGRLRRRALRHRRADPHHRLQGGAHQRRRCLVHATVRGLLPPRHHVVLVHRRPRALLDVARDDHGVPRGRARPSPPVRAGRSTRPTC